MTVLKLHKKRKKKTSKFCKIKVNNKKKEIHEEWQYKWITVLDMLGFILKC